MIKSGSLTALFGIAYSGDSELEKIRYQIVFAGKYELQVENNNFCVSDRETYKKIMSGSIFEKKFIVTAIDEESDIFREVAEKLSEYASMRVLRVTESF